MHALVSISPLHCKSDMSGLCKLSGLGSDIYFKRERLQKKSHMTLQFNLISFRYMKLAERLFHEFIFKEIGLGGLSLGLEDGGRRD